MNDLKNTYFVKTRQDGAYIDVTTLVDGVRVLKVDGFFKQGEPVNIYTAQWINEQGEDFMVTTKDGNDNPLVIRKNVDIEITFIVSGRYATDPFIDVAAQHDAFIGALTNGDVWMKSLYADKEVHCVCLYDYEPTTVKLKRETQSSYIMGTIKLHALDAPQHVS